MASSFALTGQDGRTLGVTDMVMDITERHHIRKRLALLDHAAARIGTTLDVTRTAAELADVLVPALADLAAIDLLDGVEAGEEPLTPGTGGVELRLTARKAARPSILEGLRER